MFKLFIKSFKLQLTIYDDHFMNNVLNILKWDAQRNLQLLRKPVDKDKWATEPAVVNAFYNPNKNDIGNKSFMATINYQLLCLHNE